MKRESAFEFYVRTGRAAATAEPIETKFNPWHDPDNGRFTFAGQGSNFGQGARGQTRYSGPLRGVNPIEKQRAAQINRFIATPNARARVPITESITLQLEKRDANVSGKFTKKGVPGSLKFTGMITTVKGKQEVRIVGMKWNASIGTPSSEPDSLRIYSNSRGLFSQINRPLVLNFLGQAIVNEPAIPQRLNRNVN